jgi:hypothetical protein
VVVMVLVVVDRSGLPVLVCVGVGTIGTGTTSGGSGPTTVVTAFLAGAGHTGYWLW